MKLEINARIRCVFSETNPSHASFRKLDLIDHNLPEHITPRLEAWLCSQIDFVKLNGKNVKVTFEVEDEQIP